MQTASLSPRARGWLRLAIQFVAFQGAWFACVLGAAQGAAALGAAVALGVVVLCCLLSQRRGVDVLLVLIALGIGLAWDTLLLRLQIVVYASPGPLHGWAPGWILALWALFATLVREPLAWLHGRPLLAAACGGVSGPLSYAGAVALGAGVFPDEVLAMAVLAVGWAVMTPLLTEAARALSARSGVRARTR